MTVSRLGQVFAVLVLCMLWWGCGDTFRPVAIPVSPPPPDPRSLHFVLVISDNSPSSPGMVSRLDVSGDTNVGNARIGLTPVHATLLPNTTRVVAANAGEATISSFDLVSPTLVTTVSLPTNLIGSTQVPAVPVFVHTNESGKVYVADSANGASGAGRVFVVSTISNVVTDTIPVGTNPVALAEMPNGMKLYAVNQGDGTVTSINAIDKTVNGSPIPTGVSPVWAIVRSDSARLYVLNSGDGTVSTIDTSSDTVLGNVSVGAGANYMVYEPKLNRLYVNNPVTNAVTALNISSDPPTVIFTTPVSATPISLAALPDGSRVYVASEVCSSGVLTSCAATGGTLTSKVTVINTNDGSIRTTLPLASVPAAPQCSTAQFDLFVAAAGSSSRVYVSNCDAGETAIIRTVAENITGTTQPADSFVLNIPSPVSSFPPPVPVNGLCPPNQQPTNNGVCQPPSQNPVFIVAGP
jgi:YVTN family beta-propeller protein